MMKSSLYIADSIQGITHSENQDGHLVLQEDEYQLFIVFDGVSMSENQIKGVQLAIDFISENYKFFFANTSFQLKELMIQTNDIIVNSKWSNALTTYCALVILEDHYVIISHLGDSRIYSVTKTNLIQHTNDDVVYPGSNILTKCLGIARMDDMDFYQKIIGLERRRILLCTDGFYELMERNPDEFIEILNHTDLNTTKNKIHDTISKRNRDDATYILIDTD